MNTSTDSKLDQLIFGQEHELEYTNKQIISDAESLIRRLQQAVDNVKQGMNVNSCGVVQSSGHDLDKLIAKRQMVAENLKKLAWAKEAK